MHDKAFTFQTLRPDTIIDGLFDLGMRVDSGLTPLNSYENPFISSRTKSAIAMW
ncbi:YihE protein [Klebsiella pneumoniae]|nr:YihE protein [Klebsiella pneumoniae]